MHQSGAGASADSGFARNMPLSIYCHDIHLISRRRDDAKPAFYRAVDGHRYILEKHATLSPSRMREKP